MELADLVSSGREPPPPALSEPYVTVSRHTAPTVRRWVGNDFNLCFGLPLGSSPEGLTSRRPWTARPLRSDPITGPSSLLRAGPPLCPASVLSHSRCSSLVVLPLAASTAGPRYRGDRFSCSMPAPAMSSRHLYTGHHRGHIQAAPRLRTRRGEPLSRDHPQAPVSMPSLFRFDASAVVHTCSSSHRTPSPADSETSTATLTTPALYRRSLRWFGISACTATPEDLPPSLAQHGSCWRSSTSSSLPFRTHVGAGNSAVAADQGKHGSRNYTLPTWRRW